MEENGVSGVPCFHFQSVLDGGEGALEGKGAEGFYFYKTFALMHA